MEMQKKLGNYTFEKQIGSGAFATVYLGRDDRTGRPVAIKMISRSNPRADPVAIEKEVHVLMKLQHPNIVKLYEFQKTQNNFYLIFEFCKHGDLQGFIKSNFPKACVPEHQAQKLAQQILAGIKAMKDKKIVHRDLKCANILVADDFVLKIADFGFARFVEAANPLLESYLGTPLTMGPEVLMKTGYDDKCDIWSLGVIIYQIIFGKFPFEPRIPSLDSLIEAINKPGALQFPSHIPLTPAAKELISAMLTVDPKARISFDDLFEHPWVTGSFSVPDPDNNLINLNASALLKSAYDNRHNVKPGDSKDPSKKPKPSTTKPFEGSVAIPKNTQEQGGDKKPQPHSGEDANQRLWNEVFGGIVVAMLAKLVRSRSQNILSLARRVEKTLTLVQTADFLNEDLQNPKYLRTHILLQTLAAMKSAMVVELGLTHEKSDKVYYNTSVQDICDIYTKNVGILKSLVAIEDQKPDLFDEMKSQFNTLYQMLKKETRHFTEDALRGVDSKEFLISSLLDLSENFDSREILEPVEELRKVYEIASLICEIICFEPESPQLMIQFRKKKNVDNNEGTKALMTNFEDVFRGKLCFEFKNLKSILSIEENAKVLSQFHDYIECEVSPAIINNQKGASDFCDKIRGLSTLVSNRIKELEA